MLKKEALATEKRRMEERYDCEAKIKWSYFNGRRFYNAKILNFSRNGIYFETPHEIKAKATLFIRVEKILSKDMRSDESSFLRTVSLADVKWCNKSSKDGVSNFKVGLRHFDLK